MKNYEDSNEDEAVEDDCVYNDKIAMDKGMKINKESQYIDIAKSFNNELVYQLLDPGG
ncbi:25819_t:CDS:1, partial [Dentiscutata erythropus]